jgi:hypothetical protein
MVSTGIFISQRGPGQTLLRPGTDCLGRLPTGASAEQCVVKNQNDDRANNSD